MNKYLLLSSISLGQLRTLSEEDFLSDEGKDYYISRLIEEKRGKD